MCVCMLACVVCVCEMSTLYLQGSITMTEFLYQNGGKLDVCDMSKKRGCLHHAVLKDDARLGGRGGCQGERGKEVKDECVGAGEESRGCI